MHEQATVILVLPAHFGHDLGGELDHGGAIPWRCLVEQYHFDDNIIVVVRGRVDLGVAFGGEGVFLVNGIARLGHGRFVVHFGNLGLFHFLAFCVQVQFTFQSGGEFVGLERLIGRIDGGNFGLVA